MNDVLYALGRLLQLYWLVLMARLVISWVTVLSQYRPTGAMAVLFEFVYTLTDPPLRFLRRFIPDLRLGSTALDLSFLVLVIGVLIVSNQLVAG